jgi:SAM-dependent methyltransferase
MFGCDPAGYAAGRPGYPQELFDVLTDRCGLREGTATLEIGPGAGQATAELLARGAAPVIAVEPDPKLAAYLAERFGDRVDVRNVRFEDADILADSVCLAVSATAWHWVDQEVGLGAIARALKSGGWWAAWWTVYHDPTRSDALYEALLPVLNKLPSPPIPSGSKTPSAFAFDKKTRTGDLNAADSFQNIDVEEYRWTLDLDPLGARKLYSTFARILALPERERENVLRKIESIVEGEFNGSAQRPVVTILYTAQRV